MPDEPTQPDTGFTTESEDNGHAATLAALDPRERSAPPGQYDPDFDATQVQPSDEALLGLPAAEDRGAARESRLRTDRSLGGTGITSSTRPEAPEPPMPEAVAEDELAALLSTAPVNVDEITETVDMQELAKRLSAKRIREAVEAGHTPPPPLKHFWVKVRALLEGELDTISTRAERDPTRKEKEAGARGPVRDLSRFNRLVCLQAIVTPNFADPALKRDGPTPEHVMMRWFLGGEIDQLSDVVTDISGWSRDAVKRVGKS